MIRTLSRDARVRNAHEVDFVVRKDGFERRIEADWIKKIARIVLPGPWPPGLKEKRKTNDTNNCTGTTIRKQTEEPSLGSA
jgi:hypothetical protein